MKNNIRMYCGGRSYTKEVYINQQTPDISNYKTDLNYILYNKFLQQTWNYSEFPLIHNLYSTGICMPNI